MLSSIGCPYHCTYCAANIIQPHFIERNPHAVFKEILYYRDLFSIQDIAFYDDALLLNAESRFMPLAEKIIAQNLNIRFHTPNGLNIRFINERISHLLHNAGFKTIRLSFESASGRIQQDSSMKATNEELKRAQKYLRKAGYHKAEIEVYVMVGLPHQSHAEVIHTINFVHDLGLTVKLVQYSPIPHTVDYERTAAQYDFIKEDPLYHNNTVFASKTTEIGAAHLHEIKNLVQELNNKVCTGAKTKGGQS